MVETDLTRCIKQSLRNYRPLINSPMRTVRWAEEVDVETGFVDSIRFEDCFTKTIGEYSCNMDKCKLDGFQFPCKHCKGCIHKHNGTSHEYGIAVTCFEIKITKSDFKSKNGHNFVGNYNYYVVPKGLYSEVKDLVPIDIGIITYDSGRLLKRKECTYKEVTADKLSIYLYNSLKKWVKEFEAEYSYREYLEVNNNCVK